ncbi:MAG TPA: hypothetical protein VK099_09125 [Alcanivoracaceae bacterium]|nr:hypothetical protein [Alcanivoracaceae bacterium]
MSWWWILGVAACSSGLTIFFLALWVQLVLRPSMMREVEQVISTEGQKAAELIAQRVEEAVKKGLVEGVKNLPSKDVLQGTTRALAKTSAEIVEGSISSMFWPRRGGGGDKSNK